MKKLLALLVVLSLIFSCCGQAFADEPPLDVHDDILVNPATCGKEGLKYVWDKDAGEYVSEVIPATGEHTWDYDKVKKATCTTSTITGCFCKDCGVQNPDIEPYDDGITLGGHIWDVEEGVTTAATCKAEGKVVRTCVRVIDGKQCGFEDVLATIPVDTENGHNYELEEEDEPSCIDEKDGSKKEVCSICGDVKYTKLEWAHKWGEEPVKVTPADCGNDGEAIYKCTVDGCEATNTVVIPATGEHVWGYKVVKPATCTTPKMTGSFCKVCGQQNPDIEPYVDGEPLNHDWDDEEGIEYPATCQEPGKVARKCQRCEVEEKLEDLPIDTENGHEWKIYNLNDEPQCWTQTDGSRGKKCNICDEVRYYKVEWAHTWDEGVVTKPATCAEDGEMLFTCTVCAEHDVETTKTEPIPKLEECDPRNIVELQQEATCTTNWRAGWFCTVCGKMWEDDNHVSVEKPGTALGHDWSETVVVPATCQAGGFSWHECLRDGCDAEERFDETEADPDAHVFDYDNPIRVKDPDLYTGEDGSQKYACQVEGCDFEMYEAIPCDHKHSFKDMTVEATCTMPKMSGSICEICGEPEAWNKVLIDWENHDLGHLWGEPIEEEATCLEEGRIYRVCDRCGKEELLEELPKGHNFDEDNAEIISEADCLNQKQGIEKVTCKTCGAEEYRRIDWEHEWDEENPELVSPACCKPEQWGYQKYTCLKCGAQDVFQDLDPDNAHDWQFLAKVDHMAAFLCTICGAVEHVYDYPCTPGEAEIENVVDPTCAEVGTYDKVTYCTICGEEISREAKEIEKLAHTPGEAVKENEVAATCAKAGTYDEVVYCTECNEEVSRVAKQTEKLAHTPGEPVKENEVAPTCSTIGTYDVVVYCTECEEELSRVAKESEKLPHTPGEPVKENETATGYEEVVYCTVCEEEISREFKEIPEADYELGRIQASGGSISATVTHVTGTKEVDAIFARVTMIVEGRFISYSQPVVNDMVNIYVEGEVEAVSIEITGSSSIVPGTYVCFDSDYYWF